MSMEDDLRALYDNYFRDLCCVLQQRNKALGRIEALRRYAYHLDSCAFSNEEGLCSCGLEDLLKPIVSELGALRDAPAPGRVK